jgi:hypothetical protein
MSVLDALDPRGDRALDLSRRIGVHSHVGIPVGSGLDTRAELRLAELNMSSVVRGDATPPPPTSLICEAP